MCEHVEALVFRLAPLAAHSTVPGYEFLGEIRGQLGDLRRTRIGALR